MREHSLLRTIEKLGIRLARRLFVMEGYRRNQPEPSAVNVSDPMTGNPEVMWHVPRSDCVQVVYKKAGLKDLKMDLSNAESTTDS